MQQSLLRVIQEKEITPVGDTRTEKVNVRIICATNKNLLRLIKAGEFRQDLYYRISEAELHLPSLNEYPFDEKKEIVNHIIEQQSKLFNKKLIFGQKILKMLYGYSYPGNIRELIALIRNIYIFNEDKVDLKEVELLIYDRDELALPVRLEDAIKQHVKRVYLQCNKNKKKTAAALGIAVNTLNKYLKD